VARRLQFVDGLYSTWEMDNTEGKGKRLKKLRTNNKICNETNLLKFKIPKFASECVNKQ
jgi:hypothetical protein